MSAGEEIVFCTDLTDEPEEYRRTKAYYPTVFDESEEVMVQYGWFMHEAEVFVYALANAVQSGKMTADEAREHFEPYKEHLPDLYDLDEMNEYEYGFITVDDFMDWGSGPGTPDFWRAADELEIDGVYFNEGEHPGGSPVFYLYRREALAELQEALAGRYKLVVTKGQAKYETTDSSDIEAVSQMIERARTAS